MSPENPHANPVAESYSTGKGGIWIGRLFSALAFGIVLYLFWPLLGELQNAVDLIIHARWGWLDIAVCIQFVSYMFLAKLNHLLLSPFEGKINFWRMMATLPAMAFIEVAVPSAGLSGVVLRARLLGKNGYSVEASSFTLVMETIYVAVVMTGVSMAGVWYLLRGEGIRPSQLAALVVVVIALIGLGIFIFRIGSDRRRGTVLVTQLAMKWNRLLRAFGSREISIENLKQRAELFYDGIYRSKDISPLLLLGLSLCRVLLDIATLGVCFIAFHYVIPPGILLTGYGLVLVMSGLAALPGGLGLVDVSLAVIFSRLGAPGAVAGAAALCYRLIAFWLVRFVGFITWQVLKARL
jgi:uncharacterized protein (TIRG00374 family)